MDSKYIYIIYKELCSRLPYGVICEDAYGNALELNSIDKPNTVTFKCSDNTFWTTDLDKCKPYLFPLSSMTPKQKAELAHLTADIDGIFEQVLAEIEFYHRHHIDYRGLIEMGLAIDATGLGIY